MLFAPKSKAPLLRTWHLKDCLVSDPYLWISKIHIRISVIHLWISIIYFWISIIYFWISKIEFRTSQNNYGYYFWMSKTVFQDIQKSIYGYPKIHFWIAKNHSEFWISIIRFLDIYNSFLDIQKSAYFRISKNPFFDIQKSC